MINPRTLTAMGCVVGWRAPDDDPDDLLPEVYDELRRIARAFVRRERPGQTIEATELVNEVWIRLAKGKSAWTNRRHYIGIAARAMRQILVERARARGAQKRWGGLNRVTLSDTIAATTCEDAMLPALDEALARLEQFDPQLARIVDLRYFVGLSIEETAAVFGLSQATVKRRWSMARAWLYREMNETAADTTGCECTRSWSGRSKRKPPTSLEWLARSACKTAYSA